MMTRDEFRDRMHGPLRKLLQAALREEAARTTVLAAAGKISPTTATAAVTEAAILDVADTLYDAFGVTRAQEALLT